MTITALLPDHWSTVKAIYEDGLATGQASFRTSAPSWEEWDASHYRRQPSRPRRRQDG